MSVPGWVGISCDLEGFAMSPGQDIRAPIENAVTMLAVSGSKIER
jgi:hypothetical protein